MIRVLRDDDATAFATLRRRALEEVPLAFGASPDDDLISTPAAVREHLARAPDAIVLGAFRPELVGMMGLFRDRHLKYAHKAHLWGAYVVPEHRRSGCGTALLDAVLAHARTLPGLAWVHLSVGSAVPEARRLYERAGFQAWGVEPDALRHAGTGVALHHMALRLA